MVWGGGLPTSGLGLVCPLGVGAVPSVWAVWGAGGGAFSVPTPVFVVRSPLGSNLLNQAAASMSYNVAISACGKDQQPLRERALDLWRCCGTNAY